jgi:hypothetical protein
MLMHLCVSIFAGCAADPVAGVPRAIGPAVDAGDVDAMGALSWVDLAVADCPTFDAARPGCTGPAPLELRFVALAPAPFETAIWTFGDGSAPESGPSPRHRFRVPGSYTVSVTVGGAGGTARVERTAFVTVVAAGAGAACSEDTICGSGVSCQCRSGCPGLPGGFCGRACSRDLACPTGLTCVDLGARGGNDGWPGAACLQPCNPGGSCPGGWTCRQLPAAAPVGSWTRACFPRDVLVDEGGSCMSASGSLDSSRCLGGDCAPLGARGLCAATCDAGRPCPDGALCATFTGGERRCLVRCGVGSSCGSDPFLACELASTEGRLGFSVAEPGVALCAPKRCSADAACGPDGLCDRGFCGKKP